MSTGHRKMAEEGVLQSAQILNLYSPLLHLFMHLIQHVFVFPKAIITSHYTGKPCDRLNAKTKRG